MALKLESARCLPGNGVELKYTAMHSTGGRDGTTLDQPLTLVLDGKECTCSMEISDCKGATPDEALHRMAGWLRRLADGIEKRGASVPIPLA